MEEKLWNYEWILVGLLFKIERYHTRVRPITYSIIHWKMFLHHFEESCKLFLTFYSNERTKWSMIFFSKFLQKNMIKWIHIEVPPYYETRIAQNPRFGSFLFNIAKIFSNPKRSLKNMRMYLKHWICCYIWLILQNSRNFHYLLSDCMNIQIALKIDENSEEKSLIKHWQCKNCGVESAANVLKKKVFQKFYIPRYLFT